MPGRRVFWHGDALSGMPAEFILLLLERPLLSSLLTAFDRSPADGGL